MAADIKLTRKDLAKLSLHQVRERIAERHEAAQLAAQAARGKFQAAVNQLLVDGVPDERLSLALSLVGSTVRQLKVTVHLDAWDDMVDEPPGAVSVTVRDGAAHDCRLMLRFHRELDEKCKGLLREWLDLVREERELSSMDQRVRALEPKAAVAMIDEQLKGDAGAAVRAALREFNKGVNIG